MSRRTARERGVMLRRIRRGGWGKAFTGALIGVLAGTLIVTQFVSAQGGTTVVTCVTNSDGALSVLSDPTGYTNARQTCSGTEPTHLLDLDTVGPVGAAGPAGAAGQAGATGATGAPGASGALGLPPLDESNIK